MFLPRWLPLPQQFFFVLRDYFLLWALWKKCWNVHLPQLVSVRNLRKGFSHLTHLQRREKETYYRKAAVGLDALLSFSATLSCQTKTIKGSTTRGFFGFKFVPGALTTSVYQVWYFFIIHWVCRCICLSIVCGWLDAALKATPASAPSRIRTRRCNLHRSNLRRRFWITCRNMAKTCTVDNEILGCPETIHFSHSRNKKDLREREREREIKTRRLLFYQNGPSYLSFAFSFLFPDVVFLVSLDVVCGHRREFFTTRRTRWQGWAVPPSLTNGTWRSVVARGSPVLATKQTSHEMLPPSSHEQCSLTRLCSGQ